MLTYAERIAFVIMVVVLMGITAYLFYGIFNLIRRGAGAPALKNVPVSLARAAIEIGLQLPIYRARPILSTFHAFIFFGFSYYLLVNATDLAEGFVQGFELVYGGSGFAPAGLVNVFNLVADIISVLTLIGMVALLIRRFFTNDRRLAFNPEVLLHPKVAGGSVRLDSAIVGIFILIHIGSRFMGQVFRLARTGEPDPFMPFASLLANLFEGMSPAGLNLGIHITWWAAIALIFVMFPYLLRSKHIHLIVAPLNLGLAKQNPRGALDPVANGSAPTDGAMPSPGAETLLDLSWPRLLDGYACIMCNRCHDVCPAHTQGLSLSPSALEINKRYIFNDEFFGLSGRAAPQHTLLEDVISPEAVWACTTCYACVRVCPVGNEPMADIIDIRRRMVFDGNGIDSGVQGALESLAKNGNAFGQSKRKRSRWTKEIDFKVKDATQEPVEYLWFVGDTASFDERVIPLTQTVARVLQRAEVDFGILYNDERSAGNDVRRVGEEGLFEQLVEENLATFGKSQFNQILTTDPHSLNTLRNEYPQYGGMWRVHHYARFLLDLIDSGRLEIQNSLNGYLATYHDPCYLGRYNGGYAAPRELIQKLGVKIHEMPRNQENSFCCGAGGGQIWMGSTPPGERPAENRIREAIETLSPHAAENGRSETKMLFLVACPKDVVMYTDAVKTTGNEERVEVRDLIELVEEALG